MKRNALLAILAVGLACSKSAPPKVTPVQGPSEPQAAGSPSSAEPTSVATADSLPFSTDSGHIAVELEALDRKVAADSAADVDILEQLAAARPETGDSGAEPGSHDAGGANAIATPEVTYDIDVATYNSHSRVQYYLDFFQGVARERMTVWLQRMPRYEAMIRAKLRDKGVPEDMVYLALIESGYSNTAVSRSRATGMWQFMKGTGKLYGLRVDHWVDERRDPFKATDAAARHLSDLRDRFGSMYLAAAAYNAGAGKVGRSLRRLGDDDEEEDNPDADFFRLYDTRYLRRETKDYVPKLIAAALIAKQPEKYGFTASTDVPPIAFDSIVVPDVTGLDVIARLADTSVTAIRELNPQFLRGVTPPKSRAIVRLPLGTAEKVAAGYAALPGRDRVTFVEHIVTRGQTVGVIARLYGVSSRAITAANPEASRKLRTGQRLVIPTSGTIPSAAAVRAADAPSASVATAGGTYRVRPGESVWSVSQKFGVSMDDLRSWNDLSATESLRIGQRIRVVAPGADAETPVAAAVGDSEGVRTHLVRPGETLSGIATKYGVKITALRSANGLTAQSVLKAGTRLKIPG